MSTQRMLQPEYRLLILFILLYMKPTHKTVYTVDIKKAQRVLLARWQLQGRATDAAP